MTNGKDAKVRKICRYLLPSIGFVFVRVLYVVTVGFTMRKGGGMVFANMADIHNLKTDRASAINT